MSMAAAAPVNLAEKLSQFSELWSQKKVAVLNDYEVKLAKLKGEFVWHTTRAPMNCSWSSAGVSPFSSETALWCWNLASCSWCPVELNTAPWRTRRPRSCCSSRQERSTPVMQGGR